MSRLRHDKAHAGIDQELTDTVTRNRIWPDWPNPRPETLTTYPPFRLPAEGFSPEMVGQTILMVGVKGLNVFALTKINR